MSIRHLIHITQINNTKKFFDLKANLEELIYLKEFLDVLAIDSLSFQGFIKRQDVSNNFLLEGLIIGKISQECSITAEKINVDLHIPLKRTYKKEKLNKSSNKEIIIDFNDEDVEPLTQEHIMLFDVIKEELLLNINPYIKKEGL